MGNYITAKAEITDYIIARTPLVIIDTCERERAERLLKEIAVSLNTEIGYYTDAKQVTSLTTGAYMDIDSDPLEYIAGYFRKHRSSTFVFGDVKRIGDDNVYSRELLNILYLAKESNSTLVLITPDNVWSRLTRFGMISVLDYPDNEERTRQIEQFVTTYKFKYPIAWDSDDIRLASTYLRGFSEIQIENILSSVLVSRRRLDKEHIYQLTEQKNRLYSPVSAIQPVRLDYNTSASGLSALKQWLSEQKKVFFASEEMLKQRDLTTPKGILLAGVPGCGKSLSAKMVAMEWKLPLFRFDMGTIYDKWVGESEKKMKEALQFIDNVSPCIVWVDEIEKALSVSDTGNDTGKRVLGQFLFWLQESESRVFLVATANDISQLPFELFRKGRFSEVFFIDLPDSDERREVIAHYAARALHLDLSQELMNTLVTISEGYSYSDIEYAIKSAAQSAYIYGEASLNDDLITEKFREIVPISKSNPDMVEKIREWGKNRAVSASGKSGGKINE